MQFLTEWKNSFSIFYPLSNFKQFCLSVWQEFKINVPLFFKKFWWLYLLSIFTFLSFLQTFYHSSEAIGALPSGIASMLLIILLLIAPYWKVWHKNSSHPFLLLLLYYATSASFCFSGGHFISFRTMLYVITHIHEMSAYHSIRYAIHILPYLIIAYVLFVQYRKSTQKMLFLVIKNLPISGILIAFSYLAFRVQKTTYLERMDIQYHSDKDIFIGIVIFSALLFLFCLLNLFYASLWRVFYDTRSKQLDR
jgi:hypothetical protein